jgi:hypothetical protein
MPKASISNLLLWNVSDEDKSFITLATGRLCLGKNVAENLKQIATFKPRKTYIKIAKMFANSKATINIFLLF